jgi:hypothetical protein
MKPHPIPTFVCTLWFAFLLTSCAEKTPETPVMPATEDTTSISGGQFQNQLFSLPSPVHTAMLMEKAKVEFNETLLNPLDRVDTYVSEVDRALNMGIYGADMAYISNYDRPQLSQQYFTVVGNLANQLDILQNIDQSLLRRFNDNAGTRDSLLSLTAEFYTEGDLYLRTSERQQLATLIVLGGWIEALYIACHSADKNHEVISRIGEQYPSVKNMASIVGAFDSPACKDLTAQLNGLADAYQGIESLYKYDQTITDQAAKTTYLRGRTITNVTDAQLKAITAKVDEIRNAITQ